MYGKFLSLFFILFCFSSLMISCSGDATTKEDPTVNESPTKPKEEKKKKEKEGYKVGDLVEDFELQNVDDKMVSLASLGEEVKGATIVFTCNSCPYAVKYEDRLVEISQRATKAGYPVIAIMPNDLEIKPDDSMDNMKKRAQEKGFDFPYVIDAEQKVFPKFGATKTPEVYVLNKTEEGFKVAYHGAIDDNHDDPKAVKVNYIDNAFAALKEGKEVDPGATKAIGCSIKCKK